MKPIHSVLLTLTMVAVIVEAACKPTTGQKRNQATPGGAPAQDAGTAAETPGSSTEPNSLAVSEETVKQIPEAFRYEGSEVSLLYSPSAKVIKLRCRRNRWEIVKNDLGSEIATGKILMVGTVPSGTKLPDGTTAGKDGQPVMVPMTLK